MNNYLELSVKEATDTILHAKNALILDTRDSRSYKDGHIEGAMHAHNGLIEHLLASQQFERPVLVYCYHGTSSKKLAERFGETGYTNTYSMRGGYTAWKKKDYLYAQANYSQATQDWLERECFEPIALNATIDAHITPLMLACSKGNVAVVDELLQAGADVHLRDAEGDTALWFASLAQNETCILKLLAAGADIDSRNIVGNSALMGAANVGKTAIVKFLVSRGADVSLCNRQQQTALDLACSAASQKFLRLFIDTGVKNDA